MKEGLTIDEYVLIGVTDPLVEGWLASGTEDMAVGSSDTPALVLRTP